MQVKTMESGLYIPRTGSITPRSTQGNVLKGPADVPASALKDPSGRDAVYKIMTEHILLTICYTWSSSTYGQSFISHNIGMCFTGMLLISSCTFMRSAHRQELTKQGQVHTGAAEGALIMASGLHPAGSAIHRNLADKLKAAKVQTGQQAPPAGANVCLMSC